MHTVHVCTRTNFIMLLGGSQVEQKERSNEKKCKRKRSKRKYNVKVK